MSLIHSLTLPCAFNQSTFSSFRILLTTNILTGLGDVAATVKLLAIFQKYVSRDRLALCAHREDFEHFHFFDREIHDIKKIIIVDSSRVEDVEKDQEQIADFNPTCVVSFNRGTPFRSDLFARPIPALGVKEYGYSVMSPDEYYHSHRFIKTALGLRRCIDTESLDSLGLFQDASLIEYYLDRKNQDACYRHMTYLPQLSQGLLRAILPNEELKGSIEEKIASFSRSNKLYFGYVGEYFNVNYIKAFIGAMIIQSSKRAAVDCNLTFILPGSKLISEEFLSKDFRCFLIENGFISLCFIFEKDHKVQEYHYEHIDLVENKENPGRQLILLCSLISHDDFLLFMKASEVEVLGTGDQSISEELSAGKKVYYQVLPHKKKFGHDLAELISKVCKIAVDFCPQLFYGARFNERAVMEWMHIYFDMLHRSNWDDLICEIHRNHNLEKRILSIVSKMESIL